eukprot:jgi/Mesvir1/20830/Mv26437-RA.1
MGPPPSLVALKDRPQVQLNCLLGESSNYCRCNKASTEQKHSRSSRAAPWSNGRADRLGTHVEAPLWENIKASPGA